MGVLKGNEGVISPPPPDPWASKKCNNHSMIIYIYEITPILLFAYIISYTISKYYGKLIECYYDSNFTIFWKISPHPIRKICARHLTVESSTPLPIVQHWKYMNLFIIKYVIIMIIHITFLPMSLPTAIKW